MSEQYTVGTPEFYGGTAGTVNLGAGEVVVFISAWASGAGATLQILGRPTVAFPIPQAATSQWWVYIMSQLVRASSLASTLVFTGTSSYFVHTVKPGGTATAASSGL